MQGKQPKVSFHIVDLARVRRPAALLFECVMGAPWQLLKERMEAIGYHVTFVDLSPCHIGVPQTRSRLYMVRALSSLSRAPLSK